AIKVVALDALVPDGGIIAGFKHLYEQVPEKFSMILSKGEIITPNGKDAWWDLPGLSVIIGGLWVANLYYWGFNQYIIQRTLAAKSLKESQKGIAFAAFLKLLIPIIVVLPGIIAYVMNLDPTGEMGTAAAQNGFVNDAGVVMNDNAAPWLIKTLVPNGLKGLVLAALVAAIVSSLASMLNSTATIFTMDIYKPYINPEASAKKTVNIGRLTVGVSLIIAVLIAPLLGNLGQAFQFIQEYTGLVSPGILAAFMTGLFMKKATNNGAIWGVILSVPIAFYFKVAPNEWSNAAIFVNIPFMQQMFITCIISIIIVYVVSILDRKGQETNRPIIFSKDLFKTSPAFNISAVVISIICSVLYAIFW
ncbi:MAG: sodium/solute symporter, partial [Bacteroidota bacterium]